MVFRISNGRCPTDVPAVGLKVCILNLVLKLKYLEHYITEDLKNHADIEKERKTLAVRCNILVRRLAWGSKQVKISLFKSYCQVFYTFSLWINYKQRAVNDLRVLYNNDFRVLMRLPRFCNALGMFAEARVADFYAIMRKSTASLF